jgi:hypothetical protein
VFDEMGQWLIRNALRHALTFSLWSLTRAMQNILRMSPSNDLDLLPLHLRLDGRASIEHQISIHVNDLFDVYRDDISTVSGPAQQQSDVALVDVLAGLRYVMDYRIKGTKQPNLELGLMRKLAEALLIHMQHKAKTVLIRVRFIPEADMAFQLFGEFLEEGMWSGFLGESEREGAGGRGKAGFHVSIVSDPSTLDCS